MDFNFAVPCLLGLESLIAGELKEMGAQDVTAENGRVLFSGNEYILARANICSRFAERIQILCASFEAKTFEELFQGARSVPWEIWIGKDVAFPVTGYSIDSTLFSVRDCQAVIKKAVVEHMKQVYKIEWFDETGPVHRIQFSIMKDRVSLLIDTSGNGLHKRGYRAQSNSAPIKETIAAALCALSHLKPYHKFYDPLCGSGTILIEGAMMAKNIAPGINRSFSAERFEFINRDVWRRERERAKELERVPNDFFAFGSDIDNAALNIARENAVKAGVNDIISFTLEDVRNFHPSSERGTLITNPPYGERMSSIEECKKLYESMGKVFEKKRGWSYSIITPDEDFEESFGRKADKTRKLYNGMIKCRLFMFYK